MSKPKLLVIDDEEYICKQIKWGLSADYEVEIALNDHGGYSKIS